jgi:ketosteroid isomerase-like protein
MRKAFWFRVSWMDDLYAINLAKTEYREGFNNADPDRILSVFSEAPIHLPDGLPSFYGSEARDVMRTRLEKLFRQYRAEVAVIVAEVNISGAQAVDWGWHQFTLTPLAGGEVVTRRERYVELWQKQADDNWKIAWFINNQDLPPAMPEAN